MKLRIVMIIVLLSSFAGMRAQNDPVLAGMIALYTEKAEKELKNQEQVMLLMSTGHIWTKEEVEATINLQREFNSYLDSFRSIICYAAQIYGFYHEITMLTDNMGCSSYERIGCSTFHQTQQDLPRTDYEQHRDSQ